MPLAMFVPPRQKTPVTESDIAGFLRFASMGSRSFSDFWGET
jgi:hypothetical protein